MPMTSQKGLVQMVWFNNIGLLLLAAVSSQIQELLLSVHGGDNSHRRHYWFGWRRLLGFCNELCGPCIKSNASGIFNFSAPSANINFKNWKASDQHQSHTFLQPTYWTRCLHQPYCNIFSLCWYITDYIVKYHPATIYVWYIDHNNTT